MDIKLVLWSLVKKEFSMKDILHATKDEELIQNKINEITDAGIIESIELDNYQICDISKEEILSKVEGLTEKDYDLAVNEGVVNELAEDFWKDAYNDEKPEEGKKIVLLIQDLDNIVFNTARSEFHLKQSSRIATYKDGKWNLLPPYPKYDINIPGKNLKELNDQVKAVAWRELNNGEEEMYHKTISLLHEYEKFNLDLDEKSEKDMFEALTFLRDVVIALMDPNKLDKGLIGMTNRSLSYLSDIINKINFGE